jgi:hypothetical protein
VAAAGAGLVVAAEPGAAGAIDMVTPGHAPRIRAAIDTVLADVSYRQAAGRVADEMRSPPSLLIFSSTSAGKGDRVPSPPAGREAT